MAFFFTTDIFGLSIITDRRKTETKIVLVLVQTKDKYCEQENENCLYSWVEFFGIFVLRAF